MHKSVLTIGTFDGIHRGHQALIRKVTRRARAVGAKSVVLAFNMPPRHAGDPLDRPVLLTTLAEKLQILKRLGIDGVDVLVFDRKTASTLPEDFFDQTILKKHRAVEVVVGPRVAFGKNRSGRLPLLRRLGKKHRVRIHVVSSVAGGKGAVSSRRIRALLTRGSIEKVNALLGYPYSVAGKVVHGSHRGKRLGFPTANIQVEPSKMLPRGVFWVKVHPASALPLNVKEALKGIDGLCNVGVRPTFSPHSHALHCEVFLFGTARGRHSQRGGPPLLYLYGHHLRVIFLRRIRAEKRFSSPEALSRQISKDLATARLHSRRHRPI